MNHLAATQRANDLANGAAGLDGFGIGGRAVPRAGMRQLPGGNKGRVPRAANRPSGVLQDARTHLDGQVARARGARTVDGIGLPSIGATGAGGGRQPRGGSGRRARGQSHWGGSRSRGCAGRREATRVPRARLGSSGACPATAWLAGGHGRTRDRRQAPHTSDIGPRGLVVHRRALVRVAGDAAAAAGPDGWRAAGG